MSGFCSDIALALHAWLYPSHCAPALLWSAAASMDSSPRDSETASQCELKGLCIGGRAYEHVENTGEHLWSQMGLCVSFLSFTHLLSLLLRSHYIEHLV